METMPGYKKEFPEGMVPLGDSTFQFSCHQGLSCFTFCCNKVDMLLYPFDVILLKKLLKIRSNEFLERYTRVVQGHNPYFPGLMMKMAEDEKCPFLSDQGCTVYEVRPFSCRMYPLERAVNRSPENGEEREFYFLARHEYCLGHGQGQEWTVGEWLKDQDLEYRNTMADKWTEIDTLFAANPWSGEGVAGPKQKLAFMICYNIDDFREYVRHHHLLAQFKLSRKRIRSIETDDEALLLFGFDWLKFFLAGEPVLKARGGK